jgi:hypothetical protein
MRVALFSEINFQVVCLDTGYVVSIIDRRWLLKHLPDVTILTTEEPVNLRGIRFDIHSSSEYVLVTFYVLGRVNDQIRL